MTTQQTEQNDSNWRDKLHEVIFEAETPAGKAFDAVLVACIILSVIAVILESVDSIEDLLGDVLYGIEWFFTILFTIEYVLRLISIRRPRRYATSFFGIVDLLAIVPTYLSVFIPGSQSLLTIRMLRLLRVFRVFKLSAYLSEAYIITDALKASRRKIIVFLSAVLTIVVIMGSLVYVIEGEENGFVNIPTSIYWAIVTLTTVGYGDIAPQTAFGQVVASVVMIMGYAIIAVPTGIVTVEIARSVQRRGSSTRSCTECGAEGHDMDAAHCKCCGASL